MGGGQEVKRLHMVRLMFSSDVPEPFFYIKFHEICCSFSSKNIYLITMKFCTCQDKYVQNSIALRVIYESDKQIYFNQIWNLSGIALVGWSPGEFLRLYHLSLHNIFFNIYYNHLPLINPSCVLGGSKRVDHRVLRWYLLSCHDGLIFLNIYYNHLPMINVSEFKMPGTLQISFNMILFIFPGGIFLYTYLL